MAPAATAPRWTSGPAAGQVRQFEDVPFIELYQMNVLEEDGDLIFLDDHYWPVRSPTNNYGRQVPCVTRGGSKYGNHTRHFGAPRPNKPKAGDTLRWHCAVDLGGYHMDTVVACQGGTVMSIHTYHMGTYGMLVSTGTHGPVIHFAEIEKDSWKEFGVKQGKSVEAGQPIARIGNMGESSMLHLEMYQPAKLRDPTKYLLFLAAHGY
jgi:murein DD-endopeptidase MepM/ murein hydrolase activator NlpD